MTDNPFLLPCPPGYVPVTGPSLSADSETPTAADLILAALGRIEELLARVVDQTRPGSALANGVVTLLALTQTRVTSVSTPIKGVTIRALDTNSGVVVVSGSSGGRNASHELPPGKEVTISDLGNLSEVYLWSEAANSISWLAVLR